MSIINMLVVPTTRNEKIQRIKNKWAYPENEVEGEQKQSGQFSSEADRHCIWLGNALNSVGEKRTTR